MTDEKQESLRRNISEAVRILGRGGVVAAATETFFGLLADIERKKAVNHIVKIKKLGSHDPMLVIAPSIDEVRRLCETMPRRVLELADRYWPGPVTLILRARMTCPPHILGPYHTVALRVPGDSDATDIMNLFGKPLTATSCNVHGEPPAATARQAKDAFHGKVDFIVPGASPGGLPSTIVDATVNPPVIRRRGIVNIEGKYLRKS